MVGSLRGTSPNCCLHVYYYSRQVNRTTIIYVAHVRTLACMYIISVVKLLGQP